jgi:phosphatidylglycerol:prolipoprotein diacylglycerol transferase
VPIRKLGSVIPYVHIEPIKIGPLALQPFGVLVALGVIIGYSLALRRARRLGVDVIQLRSFIGWILLCGFVFAHVLDSVFCHPGEVLARPWTLLALWNGLSSFGGFVGAVLGAVSWKYFEMREVHLLGEGFHFVRPVRRSKPVAILSYADVILAVFPVAWIFGRSGCAVVHDHPGVRASAGSWLAVAYGPGPVDRFVGGVIELRYGNEPRYDLGLLEMLFAIVLAVGFALTWRRGHASGWYVVAACIVYAPVRFALDFLRVEDTAGSDPRYGGFTPAQWACGALLLFGIGLACQLRARAARAVAPTPASSGGVVSD